MPCKSPAFAHFGVRPGSDPAGNDRTELLARAVQPGCTRSRPARLPSLARVAVVLVVAALLGVTLTSDPLRILGAFLVVALGAGFLSFLSMTIAGVVLKRERLMGIGQMITMPLFVASNALYPSSRLVGRLAR